MHRMEKAFQRKITYSYLIVKSHLIDPIVLFLLNNCSTQNKYPTFVSKTKDFFVWEDRLLFLEQSFTWKASLGIVLKKDGNLC